MQGTQHWKPPAGHVNRLEAIARAARKLDGNLSQAVDLLASHPATRRTGLGSRTRRPKIVATLCSYGTPAVFLTRRSLSWRFGIYAPATHTDGFPKRPTRRNCSA